MFEVVDVTRIMAALKVSALLLALVTQCWTAPLAVLVDGVEFTGTGFCVGDNVTFVCEILSNSHLWTVDGPQLSISRAMTESVMVGPGNRFTLAVARPLPNDSIISTLSVTAYTGFDGVSLTCADGNAAITETLTSTASLLGPPSAPNVSLIARADFQSFNVTISTAGSSARCVLAYSLAIAENGEPLTTMAIDSNGTGSVEGLNLCKNMYTFTAVGVTKDMNSNSSGPVAGPVSFSVISELSGVSVDNGGVVEWTISSNLPGECYGNYSLQMFQCMIQGFAILPTLSDAAGGVVAGTTAAATPPTSMAPVTFSSYESVDIGNCVRPTLQTSITPADISGRLVLFSARTEASSSLCNISLMAEGVASTSSLFNCTDINATTETTVTDVTTTTIAPTGSGGGEGGSNAPVIGGVLGGIVVAVLLILIVIIIVVLLCKRASKHEVKGQRLHPTPAMGGPAGGEHGDGGTPRDMRYEAAQTGDIQYDIVGDQPGHGDGPGDMRYVTAGNEPGRGAETEYDAVTHGDQPNGHPDDNLPTYQDPETIKRQAGGDSGAIYTLVDKTDGKKKSVKKNGSAPTDEIPLYSMPDKNKKQHDPGLVYADIDVKKPAVSSRSRPPPPPQGFATEQDANGPVIYSSVQLL